MLAILNSLNVHHLPMFQPILMILVSKFMVHRALSDKTYLSLGLLSPLKDYAIGFCGFSSGSTLFTMTKRTSEKHKQFLFGNNKPLPLDI